MDVPAEIEAELAPPGGSLRTKNIMSGLDATGYKFGISFGMTPNTAIYHLWYAV